MPVIKRYPNRKLYDTEAKRYITLDGIADLIRKGQDVQVIDHTTDEDLTAVTLTQIIFEQEKKKGGFLPTSVLTGLVQAGGDTINTLRRSLTSPLDLLHHIDEEIDKRIQTLTQRGELAQEEAYKLRDKLLSPIAKETFTLPGQQHLDRLLSSRGLPSREELEKIHNQIDTLAAEIDSLLKQE
ncbi:MAG: hypothetical protein KC421_09370 [Anaerolineales bacterium]|nr:hypothetical protein [Anaerolineales bacterium]